MDTRIVSAVNNKGGVGRTTLSINIGACLSETYRVLLVDNTQNANATSLLLPAYRENNLEKLYTGKKFEIIKIPEISGQFFLLPASTVFDFNSVINHLENDELLRTATSVIIKPFDYVIIDNNRDIDGMTKNALRMSDFVISPFVSGRNEFTASIQTYETIKEHPNCKFLGFIPYMRWNKSIDRICSNLLNDHVPSNFIFKTKIPKSSRYSEYFPVNRLKGAKKEKQHFVNLSNELVRKIDS